jgi:hypothetical protein
LTHPSRLAGCEQRWIRKCAIREKRNGQRKANDSFHEFAPLKSMAATSAQNVSIMRASNDGLAILSDRLNDRTIRLIAKDGTDNSPSRPKALGSFVSQARIPR